MSGDVDATDVDELGEGGNLDERANLHDLAAGAEAWCILSRPIGTGGSRREIEDAARVVVLESHVRGEHNLFLVKITRATKIPVGHEREVHRSTLYDVRSKAEHEAFGRDVHRIWAPRDSFSPTLPMGAR